MDLGVLLLLTNASAIPRNRMAHSFSIVGCFNMIPHFLIGGLFAGVEVFRAADVGVFNRQLGLRGRGIDWLSRRRASIDLMLG